jgi:predicted phage terminase large subunit-like protein
VCLGRAGADIDVIDVFAERLPFPQQQQALVSFARTHPYAMRHLIEKKANGPAIIASLKSKLPGLIAVEPQGSKYQRADAATPECESKNVYLIEAPWNLAFVEHMAAFPNGANDDVADAFCQGVNWLRAHNYSYGLLAYSAQETAAVAARTEEVLQSAKIVKPDRGVQSVVCISENCKSTNVVRIGNSYHCNSCQATWPAVKTLEPDAKLFSRANLAALHK